MRDRGDLTVLTGPEEVAGAASELILHHLAGRQGRGSLLLAGGSTPVSTYRMLAVRAAESAVDWSRVELWWGDERPVGPSHPDSNYGQALAAWPGFRPLASNAVHRIAAEFEPEEAARTYERRLRRRFAGAEAPPFDVALLGLGNDGHTASLFPESPTLDSLRWVEAPFVESLGSHRITLTPAGLAGATLVIFLVTGSSKAPALVDALEGPWSPRRQPTQTLPSVASGRARWLVDRAAASALGAPA